MIFQDHLEIMALTRYLIKTGQMMTIPCGNIHIWGPEVQHKLTGSAHTECCPFKNCHQALSSPWNMSNVHWCGLSKQSRQWLHRHQQCFFFAGFPLDHSSCQDEHGFCKSFLILNNHGVKLNKIKLTIFFIAPCYQWVGFSFHQIMTWVL